MKRRMLLIIMIILVYAYPLYAAFNGVAIGARPIGLGKAFVGVADDANAIYWNPAGLGQLKGPEFNSMYTSLYPGLTENKIGFSQFAYAHPLKGNIGTLGIGYDNLRDDLYKEESVILSYGKRIVNGVNLGINIKYLAKQYISNAYTAFDPVFENSTTAKGVSFDAGILIIVNDKLRLGTVITDLNQPDLGLKERDKVPAQIKIGSGYYIDKGLLIALDGMALNNIQKDKRLQLGVEKMLFSDAFAVRGGGGYGNNSYKEIVAGLGYKWNYKETSFHLDYGYEYMINDVVDMNEGNHKVSLTVSFWHW